MRPTSRAIRDYFVELQARIVAALEAIGGLGVPPRRLGACQRVAAASRCRSKTAACSSAPACCSRTSPATTCRASATAHRPQLAGRAWEALGVSLVLHPRNPYAPTVHLNVRHFVARAARGAGDARAATTPPLWWFGGGMDLTPFYGFVEDARHFHAVCRDALAPFGADLYPRFKRNCDDYFFLRHRQEARGIGGIFYDDFDDGGFERAFALTRSVGDHFLDGVPADPRAAQRHAVRRARARLPGVSARPLRRIQPRLGSRHAVRAAIERPDRGDPAVDAAAREAGATTGRPNRDRPKRGSTPISFRRTRLARAPAMTSACDDDPRPAPAGESPTMRSSSIAWRASSVYRRRAARRAARPRAPARRRRGGARIHRSSRRRAGGSRARRWTLHRRAAVSLSAQPRVPRVSRRASSMRARRRLRRRLRELIEEAGYAAVHWTRLGVVHPVISYSTEAIEIYVARALTHVGAKLDPGRIPRRAELHRSGAPRGARRRPPDRCEDRRGAHAAFAMDGCIAAKHPRADHRTRAGRRLP